MTWNLAALLFQIAFIGWFAATHWIPMPPLNDLKSEAFPHEKRINLVLHALQITSIVGFALRITPLMWAGTVFWTLSLAGHILSWWIPYFFGWPKGFLENAEADNAKTYRFLPARQHHPIPDLNHCVIGILACGACITCWGALL